MLDRGLRGAVEGDEFPIRIQEVRKLRKLVDIPESFCPDCLRDGMLPNDAGDLNLAIEKCFASIKIQAIVSAGFRIFFGAGIRIFYFRPIHKATEILPIVEGAVLGLINQVLHIAHPEAVCFVLKAPFEDQPQGPHHRCTHGDFAFGYDRSACGAMLLFDFSGHGSILSFLHRFDREKRLLIFVRQVLSAGPTKLQIGRPIVHQRGTGFLAATAAIGVQGAARGFE